MTRQTCHWVCVDIEGKELEALIVHRRFVCSNFQSEICLESVRNFHGEEFVAFRGVR